MKRIIHTTTIEPDGTKIQETTIEVDVVEPVYYPRHEGDFTVIGPECFATNDGQVLCWKGVNYVPQVVPQQAEEES